MNKAAWIPTPASIDLDDSEYFRTLIRNLTGINLSEGKRELVQSRLRPRLQELGLEGFAEYRRFLERLPERHPEWQQFINTLTTNKTDWFREPGHYKYLTDEYLPAWKRGRRKKLMVWSAASSSGEEPYTLALVLHQALRMGDSRYEFEIMGSDIDSEVLQIASNGVYPKARMDQIPEAYRKSFIVGSEGLEDWMTIRKNIKQTVSFQQFNLARGSCPWTGKFDIIFCRNVFIYFSKETIAQIVENLYRAARPGAILCIGHSESLQNIRTSWEYLRPSIFKKSGGVP